MKVAESHLVDRPEADICPSCPSPAMGWQWPNVLVDPLIRDLLLRGLYSDESDDGVHLCLARAAHKLIARRKREEKEL